LRKHPSRRQSQYNLSGIRAQRDKREVSAWELALGNRLAYVAFTAAGARI